jgi:hypothetical protein
MNWCGPVTLLNVFESWIYLPQVLPQRKFLRIGRSVSCIDYFITENLVIARNNEQWGQTAEI